MRHIRTSTCILTFVVGSVVGFAAQGAVKEVAATGASAPSGAPATRLSAVGTIITKDTERAAGDAVRGAVAVAAGISNDSCASPTAIAGLGTFPFDNTLASQDGPDHAACFLSQESQIDADVWYCWTAPQTPCEGQIVVQTCDLTNVDTKIAVYDACTCPPTDANLVACQDDSCDIQTRASFVAAPGQSYLIRLGSYPQAPGGTGSFSISCQPPMPCAEPANHCQPPSGDDALTSNRTNYRVADGFTPLQSGNVTGICWWGAYFDAGTSTQCAGASPDAFQIRYFVDNDGVPGTVLATFSQASDTLTVQGPQATGLLIGGSWNEYEFHANHDPVAVLAGECYWVEITNGLTGCSWFWEFGLGDDGRAMQDGTPTTPPNGFTTGDAVIADLAFCVNVPINGGTSCLPPPPPNDDCIDATPLSTTGQFDFDNSGATTDGPSHAACLFSGANGISKDVWFCWTAPCTNVAFVRTCGLTDVDTRLAVYDGCACPTAETEPIVCNDDLCGSSNRPFQSMVTFNAMAGMSYLIRVGSFPTEVGGVGKFDITCGRPDNPACGEGAGPCCIVTTPTPSLGCTNEACCETVCACDPFCCDTAWDEGCATNGFQNSGCGAVNLCGCESPCGSPDAGDCCAGNTTPGCSDTTCCEAVCACDPFCCETEWDVRCATTGFIEGCGAQLLCTNLCGPPPTCPSGPVAFVDPPSGIVDARRPHTTAGATPLETSMTFVATAPTGAEATCWTLCETADTGAANTIAGIVEAPAGTYTITLARGITPGAATTLSYTPTTGVRVNGFFTSHPANVDGSATAAPADILEIVSHLNGTRIPPLTAFQCDIDRNGLCTPTDLLEEIDLLNGAGAFDAWNGTPLPSPAGICPPQ